MKATKVGVKVLALSAISVAAIMTGNPEGPAGLIQAGARMIPQLLTLEFPPIDGLTGITGIGLKDMSGSQRELASNIAQYYLQRKSS